MYRIILFLCVAMVGLALSSVAGSAIATEPSDVSVAAADLTPSTQIAGVLLPKRTKLVIDYKRIRLA